MKIAAHSTLFQTSKILFLKIIFFVLSSLILFWILTLDRTLIYDNDNYLKYFSGNQLSLFFNQFNSLSASNKFYFLFSEEYLWLLYADFVSFFFSPGSGLLFTVFLINILLLLSFYKLKRPIISLLFWAILPMGLAVCGVAQIRQGLAFAIFTFMYIYFNRPLLGAAIASMVHTTFCVPLLFIFIYSIFKNKKLLLLALVFLVAVALITFINYFFLEIGGRRALTYTGDMGIPSINSIIALFIFFIPTVSYLYFQKKCDVIFVTYYGLFIWILFSFFLFPMATIRIYYYNYLFLIFLFGDKYENTPFIHLYFLYIFLPVISFYSLLLFQGGGYDTLQLYFLSNRF